MTERWLRIERIFEEILPLDEPRRSTRLLELTANDESLRLEVASLLAEQVDESCFLESPVEMAQDLRRALHGDFLIGKQFGNYRVDSLIGEGGMGLVFRATETRTSQTVAIKILPPEAARDPARKRQFEIEKKAIETLEHPAIVRLLDFGVDGRFSYLVMELVQGQTVREALTSTSLNPSEMQSLIRQFISALAAVHGAGLVHGDLKPENLMIAADGQLKVVDFGLAAQVSPVSVRATVAELGLAGTIGYAAPERIRGSVPSPASDIFAAGSVLFEMLTRQPLFQGKTPWAIAEQILEGRPDVSAAPQPWRGVLRACLIANPDRRIPDGTALQARLHHSSQANPRLRLLAAAAALTAVTVAVTAGIWLWKRPSPAPPADLNLGSGVNPRIALSPDRKWIAYSRRDPADATQSHILLQSLETGPASQLTNGPFRDMLPSFSPDGKTVYFESNRSPEGIYFQARGQATPRLAIAGGHAPRVSPDGKWIAYATSMLGHADNLSAAPGLALAAVAAGFPQQWLYKAAIPLGPAVWRPDSQAFTVPAADATSNAPQNSTYLLTIDVRSRRGDRTRNEFYELCGWLDPHKLAGLSGSQGIAVDQTDHLVPDAILRGTRHIESCAVQGGDVFASQYSRTTGLLSAAITPGSERQPGPFALDARLEGASSPAISQDGRWVAYNTGAWDGQPIVQRLLDLRTGEMADLNTSHDFPVGAPRLSGSGKAALVYVASPDANGYQVRSVPAMTPIGAVMPVEAIAWDIVEEGQVILTASATTPRSVRANRPLTAAVWTVVSSPRHNLYLARISPDEKWLVFTAEEVTERKPRIYVAPYRSGTGTPFSEWISLGPGDYPAWSGSGNTVYFLDESLPAAELRAIDLDPATRRPRGAPVALYAFRDEWRPSALPAGTFRIAASRDRLLITVARSETKLLRAR